MTSTAALEKREPPIEIVAPVDDELLVENWKRLERFKQRVLTRDDYVTIAGRIYLKKSAWRKWEFACGVSDEIISFDRVPTQGKDPDGSFTYRVVVRAFHQRSGRSSVGVAAASTSEKRDWGHEEHDVFTLAHTRAKNRAIADLVGGGEVSAEEMTSDDARTKPRGDNPVPPASSPDLSKSASDLTNEKLASLMWAESMKLPQLSTVKVTPDLLEREPVAKLLYDRLKASKDASWKVCDVTYKLSVTQSGMEFLQRWQATSKGAS